MDEEVYGRCFSKEEIDGDIISAIEAMSSEIDSDGRLDKANAIEDEILREKTLVSMAMDASLNDGVRVAAALAVVDEARRDDLLFLITRDANVHRSVVVQALRHISLSGIRRYRNDVISTCQRVCSSSATYNDELGSVLKKATLL
ncbi:MAG: hypothetical protein HYU98_05570 [Deltaproteobacteria bacterium]|nr:hypothetical protein [Deltaproteobacteria bacterium]